MAEDRTPREGQLYATPQGRGMLYVRTEKRPGSEVPQHYFVEARDRVVLERWLPSDGPVPESWTLKLDTDALARCEELEAKLKAAQTEIDALTECMKTAVGVVPMPVAKHFRDVYRKARGGLLKSS